MQIRYWVAQLAGVLRGEAAREWRTAGRRRWPR
jgi:hypothetical protein